MKKESLQWLSVCSWNREGVCVKGEGGKWWWCWWWWCLKNGVPTKKKKLNLPLDHPSLLYLWIMWALPQPSSVVAAASPEHWLQTLPQPEHSQAHKPTGLQPFPLTLTFCNIVGRYQGGQINLHKILLPFCGRAHKSQGSVGAGVLE